MVAQINYADHVKSWFNLNPDLKDKLAADFTSVVTDYTLYGFKYEVAGTKDRWRFFSKFSNGEMETDYDNVMPSLRKKYEAFVNDNDLTSGRAVKRFCLSKNIELGWGIAITKVSPSFRVSEENQWFLPRRNDLIIHTHNDEKLGMYPLHWAGRGEPTSNANEAEIRVFETARTPLCLSLDSAWKDYLNESGSAPGIDIPRGYMEAFLSEVFELSTIEVVKKKDMWGFVYEVFSQHLFYFKHEDLFKEQSDAFNSPLGQHSADDINGVGDYKFPLGMLRQISDADFGALILHLHNNYAQGLNDQITMKQIRSWAREDERLQALLSKPVWSQFVKANSDMSFSLQGMLDFGRKRDLEKRGSKKARIGEFVLGEDLRLHYDEWTWPYQRFFVNPNRSSDESSKFRNFIFRVDWITASEYMSAEGIEAVQKNLANHMYHPNSKLKDRLTIGWIRYTVLKEKNAVVVDEIQSDLVSELKDNQRWLKGWEKFILWHFMMFAKKHLHYEMILVPDSSTRRYAYKSLALPETRAVDLYDNLPKSLGAKRQVTVTFNGQQGRFWVLQ